MTIPTKPSRLTCPMITATSVAEVQFLIEQGITMIDLKDPRRGSLGRLDAAEHILCSVRESSNPAITLSWAAGEWYEHSHVSFPEPLSELSYIKFGLSRQKETSWQDSWLALRDQLYPCDLVLVCYVDHELAASPDPRTLIEWATKQQLSTVMFDTFSKSGKNLLDFLPEEAWPSMINELQASGLRVALAGSLDFDSLPRVLPWAPDWIACRGALCLEGKRQNPLDPPRVQQWLKLFRKSQHPQ